MGKILLAALLCAVSSLAGAEPAPPAISTSIAELHAGVLCKMKPLRKEAAPGTTLGYTQTVEGTPQLKFEQQQVPATIGVEFGVIFNTTRDLRHVRNETYRPGKTNPDIWFEDYGKATQQYRGFVFEFPQEQIAGLWRLEAWDGEEQLYRVEFEVVPAGSLPNITNDCLLMS